MEITKIFAVNITYSNLTYNTPLIVEYKHTGEYYFLKTAKGKYILSGKDSADDKKAKGKKVWYSKGYYYMGRLAIPSLGADCKNNIWYINNSGDTYKINKVSKYGKKIHAELSQEETPTVYK